MFSAISLLFNIIRRPCKMWFLAISYVVIIWQFKGNTGYHCTRWPNWFFLGTNSYNMSASNQYTQSSCRSNPEIQNWLVQSNILHCFFFFYTFKHLQKIKDLSKIKIKVFWRCLLYLLMSPLLFSLTFSMLLQILVSFLQGCRKWSRNSNSWRRWKIDSKNY